MGEDEGMVVRRFLGVIPTFSLRRDVYLTDSVT